MRKFVIAAGLACAMAVLPITATAGAASSAKLKGKGSGSLTLSGNSFTIDGTVRVANVGPVAFHTAGTTNGSGGVTFSTTFTAPDGDTVATSSTGNARQTKIGRIFTTRDTVTGGTGRFAGATGVGRTLAKANTSNGTVKFVLAGKITY